MKIFLILFAFITTSLLWGTDYNAIGFNKYKKKSFKKAYQLFLKSTKENPKNLYGWYNLARTTYILKGKKEIDNRCDISKNPEFTILSYLTKAAEIDSKRVLELLKRDEPMFNGYKKKEVFKKWKKALDIDKTAKFFIKNRWVSYMNKFPYKTYSFNKDGNFMEENIMGKKSIIGSWKFKDKTITIKFKDETETYKLKIKKVYFNEGKNYYFNTLLEPSKDSKKSKFVSLILGPRYGDCGKYNF